MQATAPSLIRNHGARRVMLLRALSKLGICSRQQAKVAIHAGRVQVNGKVITRHTHWVNLSRDVITLDGQVVRGAEKSIYVMLNKPREYVTTRWDNLKRPTVFDLLAATPFGSGISLKDNNAKSAWIFPVGRLDYNSEGLLLFTNDGPLGDALASPDSHVPKVYRVLVDPLPAPEDLRRLEAGIRILDYTTLPAKIEIEEQPPESALLVESNLAASNLALSARWLRMTIREGKNRQIRRMFAAVGSEVLRLIRIRFGPLELDDLPVGCWRELSADEVQSLRRAVNSEFSLNSV